MNVSNELAGFRDGDRTDSPGFSEEPLDSGVRITLPRRKLANVLWIAAAVCVVGLIILVPSIVFMAPVVVKVVQGFGPMGWLALLFAAPGLAVAAGCLMVLLFVVSGRTVIDLDRNGLTSSEHYGLLTGLRRRLPRDAVGRLSVRSGIFCSAASEQQMPSNSWLGDLGALAAETVVNGKPASTIIAFGYSPESLASVANRIQREWADDAIVVDHSMPLLQLNLAAAPSTRERWKQPASSDAVFQSLPDGFSLMLPPRGIWKGSNGLMAFGVAWTAGTIAVMIAVGVALAPRFGNPAGPNDVVEPMGAVVAVGLAVVFLLAGVVMMSSGYVMGRRQAALAVSEGRFQLLEISPFGRRERNWSLDEFESASIGPSGMEVNDEPVMQLTLALKGAKPVGLFAGREEEELEWIATHIQHAIVAHRGE